MELSLKDRIVKHVKCKQHKNIIFSIFEKTPVSEHEDLCCYVEQSYKKYNENRHVLRKENVNFEDYFKVYHLNKNIIEPSLSGLEAFGDDVNKKILTNHADQMIKRTLSGKYRKLINQDIRNLFLELSLAGVCLSLVKKEIGNKLAACKTTEELHRQVTRLLEDHSRWDRTIIEKRINKNNLIEGKDYDVLFDNGKNKVVLNIHSYKAAQAFGSIMWCITRTKTMFKSYLASGNSYLFSFDFDLPITDPFALLAILTDINNKVEFIYDKQDNKLPIKENEMTRLSNLYNPFNTDIHINSFFENRQELLNNTIPIVDFINELNKDKINDPYVFFKNTFKNKYFLDKQFEGKINLNDLKHVHNIGEQVCDLEFSLPQDFIRQYQDFFEWENNKDFKLIENTSFINEINKKNVFGSSPLDNYDFSESFILNQLKSGNILFKNSIEILIKRSIEEGFCELANYIIENKEIIPEKERLVKCALVFKNIYKLDNHIENKIGFDFLNQFIPETYQKHIQEYYFSDFYQNKRPKDMVERIKKSFNLNIEKIPFRDSQYIFSDNALLPYLNSISVFFDIYDFSNKRDVEVLFANIFSLFFDNKKVLLNKKNGEHKKYIPLKPIQNLLFTTFDNYIAAGRFSISRGNEIEHSRACFSMWQRCVVDKLLTNYPQHKDMVWQFFKKHQISYITVRNTLLKESTIHSINSNLDPLTKLLIKYNKIEELKKCEKRLKPFKNKKLMNASIFFLNSHSDNKTVLYDEICLYLKEL